MLPWLVALRIWNKDAPSWCIPRKDTEGYKAVQRIRKGEKPKVVKKTIRISLDKPVAEGGKSSTETNVEKETKKEMKTNQTSAKEVKASEMEEKRTFYFNIHDGSFKEKHPEFAEYVDDYKRFVKDINEKLKVPIVNVVLLKRTDGDVQISWYRNMYSKATDTGVPVEVRYAKVYEVGKPLPKDPVIEKQDAKEQKESTPATKRQDYIKEYQDKIKQAEEEKKTYTNKVKIAEADNTIMSHKRTLRELEGSDWRKRVKKLEERKTTA